MGMRALTIGAALLAMLAGPALLAQPASLAEQQQRLANAKAASDAAKSRSAALEQAANGERDQALRARAREAGRAPGAAERSGRPQAPIGHLGPQGLGRGRAHRAELAHHCITKALPFQV